MRISLDVATGLSGAAVLFLAGETEAGAVTNSVLACALAVTVGGAVVLTWPLGVEGREESFDDAVEVGRVDELLTWPLGVEGEKNLLTMQLRLEESTDAYLGVRC